MRLTPFLIATVPPLSSVFCSVCQCELKEVAWSKLSREDKWMGWLCEAHALAWEEAGRKAS